jgi:DNA-binding MarR family transcriptional regulator
VIDKLEDQAATRVPADRHDLRILQALRKIIRSVELYSRKLALGHGITVPQLVCLLKIVEAQSISSKELAARVHLSPSTIVGIVDRLVAKGLARREQSSADRRAVVLTATAAGRALGEQAPSPLHDTLATALETLPELERVAIALSMERIVDLMQIRDLDAAPMLERGADLQSGSLIPAPVAPPAPSEGATG